MSDLTRILLAIALVASASCVLMIWFMVANDRASEQPRSFKRLRSFGASFGVGIFLLVWAAFCWHVAAEADRQQTVIRATYKSGWMSPQQGYAAAFLLFAAASYSIFLSVRGRRNGTEDGT